jgi:hypothetical protein
MSPFTQISLSCVLLVTLSGCRNQAGSPAENAGGNIATSPQTLYTIAALTVESPGPGKAVGKFHVKPSPAGIETDGLGGACLVFEDLAAPSCKADSDCKVPSYIKTPGPYAYCAENKCWIKPQDRAQCWKSSFVSPPQLLTVGTPVKTPEVDLSTLPDELFSGPGKDKINARVIACLNGKFVPGPGVIPPCGNGPGDVIHDIGPVRTLTK